MRSGGEMAYSSFLVLGGMFAVVLLIAPTLVVMVVSFTDGMNLRFPPESFSLRWYQVLISESPRIVAALENSLVVAFWTTLICTTLATGAGYVIAKGHARINVVMDTLFMSPMILPAMSFGLALLLIVTLVGGRPSTWTLVAGHTVICTPFVIRLVVASVQQLDFTLLKVSESLGASRWFTFRHVTFPLIRPGVISGACVAFLVSLDEVPVSLMLSDPRSEMLPIHLWSRLESHLDVRVASVSGVIVIITCGVVFLIDYLNRKARK